VAKLSQDDLLDVLRASADDAYIEPLETVDDGAGFDLHRAIAAIFARASEAVDTNTQAMYLYPHSEQTSAPAGGGVQASGNLLIVRTAPTDGEIILTEGELLVVLLTTLDAEIIVEAELEVATSTTFSAGVGGPLSVPVRAVRVGYHGNLPTSESRYAIAKQLTTMTLTGMTSTIANYVTDTGLNDTFEEASVGAWLRFTSGPNVGTGPRLILSFDASTSTVIVDGSALVASVVNDGEIVDLSTIGFAPVIDSELSSGVSPMLDMLGAGRDMGREPTETDDEYRERLRYLPDIVSPNALYRAASRILTPLSIRFRLLEARSTDDFTGGAWDVMAYDDPAFYNWVLGRQNFFQGDAFEYRGFYLVIERQWYGDFGAPFDSWPAASPNHPSNAWDWMAYDGYPLGFANDLDRTIVEVEKARMGGVPWLLVLAASFGSYGASAGSSTVLALSPVSSFGASAGTSTVIAVGESTSEADGISDGTSTSTAVGESTFEAAGLSDGISTVTGIATSVAVGASDGTSTAIAESAFIMSKSIDVWESSRIDFDNNLGFDYDEAFSFSFWFRPKTERGSGLRELLEKWDSGSTRGYQLNWDQGTGNVQFLLSNGPSNQIDVDFTDAALGNSDSWHHIAVSYDGSEAASGISIYIDNSSRSLATNADTLSATTLNTEDLAFSNVLSGCVGRFCNGAFWSKEISSVEVTSLYNSALPTSISDNESWWKLGEGDAPGSILDSSGNGITGTGGGHDGLFVDDCPGYDYSNSHGLRFDGNAYVDIGDHFDLASSSADFSGSIWFKTTTKTSTRMTFFSKAEDADPEQVSYTAHMYTFGGYDYFRVALHADIYDRVGRYRAPEGTYTDGQWHHFACSYENESYTEFTVRMFLDGQEVTVAEDQNDSFEFVYYGNTSPLLIGAIDEESSISEYFYGELKEFYFIMSNVAANNLTLANARKYYGHGIPPENVYPGMSPHLYFRLGTGDTYDEATTRGRAYDYDGTMNGMSDTDLLDDAITKQTIGWSSVFDGTDDCITMGDVLDKELADPISILAWMKLSGGGTAKVILGKTIAGEQGYQFGYHSGNQFIGKLKGATGQIYVRWLITLDSNWHHACFAYDGSGNASGCACYCDGVLLSMDTIVDTLAGTMATSGPFMIGGLQSSSTPNSPFNGNLAYVGLFERELTQAEVFEAIFTPNLNAHSQESDLEGFWKCGQEDDHPTVIDYGSGGNNGTMTNMVAGDIVNEFPKAPWLDTSSALDGTNDTITMGDVLDRLHTEAFSISAWFKTDSASVLQGIVAKRSTAGDTPGYAMNWDGANSRFDVYLVSTASNLIHATFADTIDTAWHHVVMTYNGGYDITDVLLYVDGVSLTRATQSNALSATMANSAPLLISGENSSSSPTNPFDGNVCGIDIFDDDLSQDQVDELFGVGMPRDTRIHTETLAGNQDGKWNCGTDDTYDETTDRSTGGSDGTLTNMAEEDFELYDAPLAFGDL